MMFTLPDGGTAQIDDPTDPERAIKAVCVHPLVDAVVAELVRLELERDLLATDMQAKEDFAPFASRDYHLHQVILRSWSIGLQELVVALTGPIEEAFGTEGEDVGGLVIEELGERIRGMLKEAYRAAPAFPEAGLSGPAL